MSQLTHSDLQSSTRLNTARLRISGGPHAQSEDQYEALPSASILTSGIKHKDA